MEYQALISEELKKRIDADLDLRKMNRIRNQEKNLIMNQLITIEKEKRRTYVSLSESIYISSEGKSFVELHNIASELNWLSYERGLQLIFKVEG